MGWARIGKADHAKAVKVDQRLTRPSKPRSSSGKAAAAPAPYPCGRSCDWNGPGTSCQSTVRGGVCPCRWC